MINQENKFTLVHGTFSPDEAGLVLFNLISSKINYHTQEKFSIEERTNGDTSHSTDRIKSLRTFYESLKDLLEVAKKENKSVKLQGDILITLL